MIELGILELSQEQLNDTGYKNAFIEECQKECLAFLDADKMSAVQLEELLEGEDMLSYGDVLVICAGEEQDAMQIRLCDVLECYTLQIVALVFRRDLLANSGNYNIQLQGMTDFEFLCRLAQSYGNAIFVFPGIVEDALELTEQDAVTCAYLLRRYLQPLTEAGRMEGMLQQTCQLMEQCGLDAVFKKELNLFLNQEQYFERIEAATAPYVIFRGDGTCHGVLRDFADCMETAFDELGQAYIVVEAGKTDYEKLGKRVCKGLVGFQTKAFGIDFFARMNAPKFQFWLDNPVFYKRQFEELPKDCHILCQDANYAEFIHTYYDMPNVMAFPPGGHDELIPTYTNREYDIVFVGGYIPETQEALEGLEKAFYDYMLAHPDKTFSAGLQEVLKQWGQEEEAEKLPEYLSALKHVCTRIMSYYRKKVVETILEAGYELHVYGDSWDAYESSNVHRLIRHSEMGVGRSLKEWHKAKIGLNIMSWHKAGMTERIANVMLSGAACLSDETTYLKEHFKDGEEIVCYRLQELDALPDKITWLLKDDNWLSVAQRGYEVAGREHTWKKRAQELNQIVENILSHQL